MATTEEQKAKKPSAPKIPRNVCRKCRKKFPHGAMGISGWSRGMLCVPCLHEVVYAGSPGYRAQVAKEGTPALDAWHTKWDKVME